AHVTEIGADRSRDLAGTGLGDERGQHALNEKRQRDEEEASAGGQGRDRSHAVTGRRAPSEPSVSVSTSSEFTTSIARPVSVRTHHHGRIAYTESSHSAPRTSMTPRIRPGATSPP